LGKGGQEIREIQVKTMDCQRPWDFFDGASQNRHQICGSGKIFHLSNRVSFKIKMGLGSGINNFAELISLKLLLLFCKEKNVTSLQVFGDSQVVVKWVQNQLQCHDILLLPILEEVQRLVVSFDIFEIHHVFRERNMVADQLSKEGMWFIQGQWMIVEENKGTFYEYYHRLFIEDFPQ
jgi:ribonuclease HI